MPRSWTRAFEKALLATGACLRRLKWELLRFLLIGWLLFCSGGQILWLCVLGLEGWEMPVPSQGKPVPYHKSSCLSLHDFSGFLS